MRKITARTVMQLLATSAAVSLLAFAFVSCTSNPASSTSIPTVDDVSSKLVADLGIVAPQSDTVRNVFHRHGIDNPAALWKLAAELKTTLTTEQKQQLLSMNSGTNGEFPDTSGMKDGCRGDSTHLAFPGMGRPDFDTPSQAMLDSEFAAMSQALNLNETQQESIKALLATQKAAMDSLKAQLNAGTKDLTAALTAIQTLRQDRDTALAGILDSTQIEIVKIHDALMIRMEPHGEPHHGPGLHHR